MSYGSTRLKTAETASESTRTITRRASRTEESATSNIQANTFHKILIQSDASPEEKMKAALEALVGASTKEENRATVRELEFFKEHLQNISEELSKQRISLTDTETFSELQRVYGDFNNDLNDFIETMKPLTDITDALYKLRQDGRTKEALEQIKTDREWDEKYVIERKRISDEIVRYEIENVDLANQNIRHAEDKSFFGYGAIKPDAMASIKINEATIESNNKKIEELKVSRTDLDAENSKKLSTRADSKEVQELRKLLDLTSEQHTQRQAALVDKALTFINNGKTRFGSIRSHLDKMGTQVEGLGDNNSSMIQIYAILNEATKQAEVVNQTKREKLLEIAEGESLIDKMKREESKQILEEHIGVLATATVDTMQAYGELTTEAIKIKNMEAATKKQSESARAMHSRGIASVASQLSTVVTAINAAAINEAQAQASSTLTAMAQVTNEVAMKESIRIATGRDDVNNELEIMLNQLASFGDVQKEATEITRDALTKMRENLAELENMAGDVGADTKEFVAVSANVVAGTAGKTAAPEAPKKSGLFKL